MIRLITNKLPRNILLILMIFMCFGCGSAQPTVAPVEPTIAPVEPSITIVVPIAENATLIQNWINENERDVSALVVNELQPDDIPNILIFPNADWDESAINVVVQSPHFVNQWAIAALKNGTEIQQSRAQSITNRLAEEVLSQLKFEDEMLIPSPFEDPRALTCCRPCPIPGNPYNKCYRACEQDIIPSIATTPGITPDLMPTSVP